MIFAFCSFVFLSIHHLNMFAEMPVRTGFRIVLSSFARIFITSRALFFSLLFLAFRTFGLNFKL
jgi:hypothetical protein